MGEVGVGKASAREGCPSRPQVGEHGLAQIGAGQVRVLDVRLGKRGIAKRCALQTSRLDGRLAEERRLGFGPAEVREIQLGLLEVGAPKVAVAQGGLPRSASSKLLPVKSQPVRFIP